MDVDLRSESPAQLHKLAEEFIKQMNSAADDENRARSTNQGKILVEAKVIGERPSGITAVDSQIVKLAAAAVNKFGFSPTYSVGSTDSNLPISLGVPAITVEFRRKWWQGARTRRVDQCGEDQQCARNQSGNDDPAGPGGSAIRIPLDGYFPKSAMRVAIRTN